MMSTCKLQVNYTGLSQAKYVSFEMKGEMLYIFMEFLLSQCLYVTV